jgi:hypothetical protein
MLLSKNGMYRVDHQDVVRAFVEHSPKAVNPMFLFRSPSQACGEVELRTPNARIGSPSFSDICRLALINITVKVGGKNPRISNTEKSLEKSLHFQSLIFLAERGDYIAPFSATLLFSVTSFVKPAFSAVYDRVSAVASVSAVPPSLSNGHRKCSKKVT